MDAVGIRRNRVVARATHNRTVCYAAQPVAMIRADNIRDVTQIIRHPP